VKRDREKTRTSRALGRLTTGLATPAVALALAASLGACGDGSESSAPDTAFAAALATVSGNEPVGSGIGWIDVERLRQSGSSLRGELAWAAGALGPGASDVVREGESAARVGVEPLRAASMVSIADSYAVGLRLDGVEPGGFEDALAAAGARTRGESDWKRFDLGAEWSTPLGSRLEPLGSLVARSATSSSAIILARSHLARDDLMSSAPPAIDAPSAAAAAGCLGDVVAARIVPNNFTHLPNVGPELLAFGVRPAAAGPAREVLCLLDPSNPPIAYTARSLRRAFDPDARDAVSGEPMGRLVSDSQVETFAEDDLQVARAELVAAVGTEPGLLFRAFNRGSLLTYMGLQPPPTPGSSP
jgi:hypothetical protein